MAAKSRKRNAQPNPAQIVVTGSNLRMETAKSTRGPKPKSAVIVGGEEFAGGFVDFLREHAVVGLAIGFIIGLQAQTVVKLLVSSFIDPTFKLLFGQALSQRTFTLHFHDRAAQFGWGSFVYGLLNFLFVLAAIYAIVKFFSLDSLDKPKKKDLAKLTEIK